MNIPNNADGDAIRNVLSHGSDPTKQSKRNWHLIIPAAIFGCLWSWLTLRGLCLVFLVPAFAALWTLHRHGRAVLVSSLWIAFALSPLSPVGFSFQNLPGPPRFVPLVMGLPGRELVAASKRGEVLLGGCMVTGFEPRWVWVW